MIRIIVSTALSVLLVSCGDTTNTPVSQLNLDRPVDVAFACYGGLRPTHGGPATVDQVPIVSAQPFSSCDIRTTEVTTANMTPQTVPAGQEDLTAMGGQPIPAVNFYGFILQTLKGTVAIAQITPKPSSSFTSGTPGLVNPDIKINDADTLTPGSNSISVGEEPIAIGTDKAGCFEVTANAGSCDLSTIEVASAVDDDPTTPVKVNRMQVINAAGQPILARPAAMAVEPNTDVIGNECPANPTGLFYIAYPNCHLVAGVDVATGMVVTGIQYSAIGTPTILSGASLANISCPAECGEPGAAPPGPGPRPVTMHLEYDPRVNTRRLAIGSDNSASFSLVELDANARPQSVSQIALEDKTGTLGITSITISPQIAMGGTNATLVDDTASPGGQAQYVYAVTTDGTTRVADVLSLRAECDTQVDPRYVRSIHNVRSTSCFPVGAPTTPPRRPTAKGPGIELLGDARPTSVEIFRSEQFNGDKRTGPGNLVGYFAVIASTTGAAFLVNVDDDAYAFDLFDPTVPFGSAPTLVMAHQLRDQLENRSDAPVKLVDNPDPMHQIAVPQCSNAGQNPDTTNSNTGPPRAPTPPTRVTPTGTIGTSKVNELPGMQQLLCHSDPRSGDDPLDRIVTDVEFQAENVPDPSGQGSVADVVFPDLRVLRSDETWTLSWQGILSLDKGSSQIDGPPIRDGQMFVDGSGMRVVDKTNVFCNMGVEPFDIVQFRGCDPANGNSDCPNGYTCYVHPLSQVPGLGQCMLTDEADRLADACRDFLTSFQRYTVGRAETGQLTLLPRKHVLRTTPVDGCTSDDQCQSLATYAIQNNNNLNPVDDQTPPDTHTYSCMTDSARAPVNADPAKNKRCVETCKTTADCVIGTVCESGLCMEGVTPPQACVNGPQRFEVHAADAFTVIGTKSGYVHSTIAQNNQCVRDPAASPWITGRIPLAPPACDPTADPFTGKNPAGVLEPNPCSLTVTQYESPPNYLPGTCQVGDPLPPQPRQAPAIKFRNFGMTITIVDPYYPGDKTCILDRAGTLGKIPLEFDGYQVSFRVTSGFFPLLLPIAPTYPIKVARGPGGSIWVVDAGDFLSGSISSPSIRGQVLRVEPSSFVVNFLQ